MATPSSKENLEGVQTKDVCPMCTKGLVWTNKVGNKWCSGTECNYHVDKSNRPRRVSEKVTELSRRLSPERPMKRQYERQYA